MSNTGLQAGLYSEIRTLSVLVDTVIADLSTGAPGSSAARTELSKLLRHMMAGGSSAHLMRYLLPNSEAPAKTWSGLPDALERDPAPPDLAERLETLARILDRSRSAAFERLRVDAR
ncbi:hypothetical protein [Bradyrhizobium vignae]|uniref:hypothetical protein n=1 Tax=Bradyrhizobium vignae TaxID=1549949 RepID=UPI000EFF405E|nr:hypothetical protein [Bradyrhizobium vignae]